MTASARWSLTPKALQHLLERLAPDTEAAALAYRSLWERLADYFDLKGVQPPEAAADETLDRVARKLEEGERIERVEAYAYGVARMVLLEHRRLHIREQQAAAGAARDRRSSAMQDKEVLISCLTRCLENLPAEERALIVGYYEGAGRSHLESRKLLAGRLGLRYETLRTRAHRLRARLEACLYECLEGAGRCP